MTATTTTTTTTTMMMMMMMMMMMTMMMTLSYLLEVIDLCLEPGALLLGLPRRLLQLAVLSLERPHLTSHHGRHNGTRDEAAPSH
jgi:hypothetical protein